MTSTGSPWARFASGVVLHGVAIVELAMAEGRLPVENFYGTMNLCAFLIALVFLFVDWRYHFASTSVALFPLVFLDDVGGGDGTAGAGVVRRAGARRLADRAHRSGAGRLCGAAADGGFVGVLPDSGAAAEDQEEPDAARKAAAAGTLDNLISRSMGFGFVLHHAGRDLRRHVGLHRIWAPSWVGNAEASRFRF